MSALTDDYGTIFAVPCEKPVVISQEKAEEILEQVRNKPPKTKEERENLSKSVKAMFGKPGANEKHDKLLH